MRCVVIGLIGLLPSLAHADTYDVDTVCGSQPQEKPLKTLCTDPLLSSTRQLERSYWSALSSASTPETYQDLHKELIKWRSTLDTCNMANEQATHECLTQSVLKFGAALESKFPESTEDLVDTDELLESAQKTLSLLDKTLSSRVESCRQTAAEKLDKGKASAAKIARGIASSCRKPALDYVGLTLEAKDESALYLLKNSKVTAADIKAEAEKRYGPHVTEALVLQHRSERKQ